MVQYDAAVIRAFAERLYQQASGIVITNAVIGVLLGGGAGAVIASAQREFRDAMLIVALIAAVIGGGLGYAIGQVRAFSLRLQAQTALCQVQIEENTRHGSSMAGRVA